MLSVQEHYKLPELFPWYLVCAAAAAALGAWVASHVFVRRPRSRRARALLFAGRSAVGFCALLLVVQAALHWIALATDWPLWLLAGAGAIAVEAVISFYRLERRIVSPRTGTAVLAIRALLVLLVVALLAQPVLSLGTSSRLRRSIDILIDDSGSMHVGDPQMTGDEKARLAELLDDDATRRPHRLDEVRREIERIKVALASQLEGVAAVGDVTGLSARQKGLERIREDLHETLIAQLAALEKQLAAIGKPLEAQAGDQKLQKELAEIKAQLAVQVRDRLAEVVKLSEPEAAAALGRNYERLRSLLSAAAESLPKLAAALAPLSRALDEDFYAKLSEDLKARVDALARRSRYDLARHALLRRTRRGDEQEAADLIDRLTAKGYVVRTYRYAKGIEQFDAERWRESYKGIDSPAKPIDANDPFRQQSNAGLALGELAAGGGEERLAGVIVFTDGRISDPAAAKNAARQLGLQKVPVTTVQLGSRMPPRDAAIVSIDAPAVVYTGDKIQFTVAVRLDGLAAQKGRVVIHKLDDKGEKTPGEPLTKDFAVPPDTDTLDLTVELADSKTTKVKTHEYLVQVTDAKGNFWDREISTENNAHKVAVNVSDDRTRLLLIESRPRWEFRYLKNLFSDRDPTVQLQYVLLEPDEIHGRGRREVIPASAGRGREEVEATALPGHDLKEKDTSEFIEEWKKFDVIVLGDVSRDSLDDDDLAAIEAFVGERGGTLVVIAGPRHMPHAFPDTVIEKMLPVVVKHGARYVRWPETSGEARKRAYAGYRASLTPAGERHVIMRQLEDEQANRELWRAMPVMHWRYPVMDTKVAATVLAYAADIAEPRPDEAGDDREQIRKRDEFHRKHSLIAVQKYKSGRVVFLGSDRTWRLRYRVGNKYHHRFWGQLLRWAVGDKLPAGTRLVRIGSDKLRYAPDEKVRIEARILTEKFKPLGEADSENVALRIFKDDGPVREDKMRPVPGSVDRFEADLGQLGLLHGPGRYRVELDSAAVKSILTTEGKQNKVAVQFIVAEKYHDEMKLLAADASMPRELADAGNGSVVQLQEAGLVADAFGTGTELRADEKQTTLWDSWPVLAMILALATAEWVMRKRAGLV